MSVAGQRHRLPDDAYYSPPWTVRVLFEEAGDLVRNHAYFDPMAGDGGLLRAIPDPDALLVANEIREEERPNLVRAFGADNVSIGSAFDLRFSGVPDSCSIVTNPAFALADVALDAFLASRGPVALLLRANWLFPARRNHVPRPSLVLGLPIRPVFGSFCLGAPKTKLSKRVKGCSQVFPRGTKGPVGSCECGGRIGPQTDASDYAWHVWHWQEARTELRIADLGLCNDLRREFP